MFSTILPLRAILFQLLFVAIAVAVEALVFHNRLKLSRKVSVEYSAAINLCSTAIGWLVFFEAEFLLPPAIKAQLISYIFFDQFFSSLWSPGMNTLLILSALLTFFGTFMIELKGMDLLDRLLQKNKVEEIKNQKPYIERSLSRNKVAPKAPSRATAVLIANACSYSVILLILMARLLEPGY